MQDLFAKAIVKAWPLLEPLVIGALTKVARQVIQQARDGTFPEKWKFLEPAFDALADDILKMLPTA